MQCLNIKNKEVAALLDEYTEILGNRKAAYYVLSENNGNGLDKAPNGADSKLFTDLLSHYNGDKAKAIQAKSKVYTDSFKQWFGNWGNGSNTTGLTTVFAKYTEGNSSTAHAIKVLLDKYITESDIKDVKFSNFGRSGKYDYLHKKINISISDEVTDSSARSLVLHELMHAATSKYAYAYEKYKGVYNEIYGYEVNTPKLTNKQIKLFEELENIKGIVTRYIEDNPEKIKGLNKLYASKGVEKNIRYFTTEDNSSSLHEFISEVFSNPGLIDVMSSIKSTRNNQSSVFSNFVKLLSKLFNLDLNQTLFKDAVTIVANILDTPTSNIADVSKVVDENGEPLVVWHGTDVQGITEFKSGYFGKKSVAKTYIPESDPNMYSIKGFNTPANEEYADFDSIEEFNLLTKGQLYPVYLSIKKPLVSDSEIHSLDRITKGKDRFIEAFPNNDGIISETELNDDLNDPYNNNPSKQYVPINSNQIKSIDNQGTFSTQNNNIYNQQAQAQAKATGRNQELQRLLQKLYPQITLSEFSDPNLRGQARVRSNRAGEVLINSLLENEDTLPHEYAHHYIAWFRKSDIVKEGTKLFGTEEKLVQAIGENSVKATKWYNRFFNWIKGLFNKKQATLNKLTKAFLNGKELGTIDDILTETHFQQVRDIPKSIQTMQAKLVESVKSRIKTTERSKFKSPEVLDSLNRLYFQLNKLENDEAVLTFANYMAKDINDSFDLLKSYVSTYKDYEKGLLPENPISADKLDLIKKGVIGFYNSLTTNIQNMLEDPEVKAHLESMNAFDETQEMLETVVSRYHELARAYNLLSDKIARENALKEAVKQGSFSTEQLDKILTEGDQDLNWWDRWVGQTQYSSSEVVRLVLSKISDTKYKVADKKLAKGKKLLDLLSKVNQSDVALLSEKDRNGKRTGNFVKDRNYGQHSADYMEHMLKIVDGMKVDVPADLDFSDIPSILNPEQLKKWNTEKNKWDSKYTERKFVPEYYELTNSLSEEARARRDAINEDISEVIRPTIDDEGFSHRENLSEEAYAQLAMLENKRRNLSNIYYSDGTIKTGADLAIAIEFSDYNKKLREKLNYKPNYDRYNKAKAKAKKELSPEKFELWQERNEVDKISEQFYEDLKKLSSSDGTKSKDRESYESARSQLTKLFTVDNKVDVESMPLEVKAMINTYDQLIAEEAYQNRLPGKKSRVMEIAEWKIDPNFYIEMDKAYAKSQSEWNLWVSQNGQYDRKGNVIPASFWKKLVPNAANREKYIDRVPNSSWVELDKESPFYNTPKYDKNGRLVSGFDERLGVTRIPKLQYYDNSKEFNKVNGPLKVLYDELLNTMSEGNGMIPFIKYRNDGRLPQIEGGALTQILSKDKVLQGLGYAVKDLYTIKDSDTKYEDVEKAMQPDGSAVRLIPTRFMKKLENPEALTNDVVGSVIAYYGMAVNFDEMSKIAPELEILVDLTGRTSFQNRKGNISGITSKQYGKMREMLDQFVYSMGSDQKMEITKTIMGKEITIGGGKVVDLLTSITRKLGIALNPYVIMTGMFTNKIQNVLEAISGIYYDTDSLSRASKEIMFSYKDALAKIGSPNNKNKALCFLEWSGSVRSADDMFSKLNQSRWLRALNQHFWYGGHEMADYITKGKMAVAVAMYYRFDPKSGKFVTKNDFISTFTNKKQGEAEWNLLKTSLYDAFTVENNALKLKPEYEGKLDEVTLNRVRNTIKQIGTRIDTQMTDLDKSFVTSNAFTNMIFIYRRFLLINLQTKFITKRQFNYSTGSWGEGQFRGAFNYLWRHYLDKNKIDTLKEMYRNYDTLDEFERGCLKRSTYEILFSTIGLFVISAFIKSLADDDKDNWWKNAAALLATRVAIESRSNLAPIETVNMFTSPTATWSTITAFGDFVGAMFNDPDEIITKGPYQDQTRFMRSLIKMTPYRGIYEAKDPRSKLDYYDNMISMGNPFDFLFD